MIRFAFLLAVLAVLLFLYAIYRSYREGIELNKTARDYSINSREDADAFIEKLSKKITEYHKMVQKEPVLYGSLLKQAKNDLKKIEKIKKNFEFNP